MICDQRSLIFIIVIVWGHHKQCPDKTTNLNVVCSSAPTVALRFSGEIASLLIQRKAEWPGLEDQTSHSVPLYQILIQSKSLMPFHSVKAKEVGETSEERLEASRGQIVRFMSLPGHRSTK